MATILQDASNAINTWNDVRNNTAATINYFNEGAYFSINRSDFATWHTKWLALNKPSNFKIHAYLGLQNDTTSVNFSLCLYSVDSNTDKKKVSNHENEYLTNLKFSNYHKATLHNPIFNPELVSNSDLDPLEALQRSTQWTLSKDTWLGQQTDMAQILVIPFKDLNTLFTNQNIDTLICQPALSQEESAFNMDLIIWGHSNEFGIMAKYPQDLIQPVPPYSATNPVSNFQLLQFSL